MKDPAFLFYPGDYLRDTQCLSENVQVAYDRIMCEHMRNICISQRQLKLFTKGISQPELEELMMVLEEKDGGYQIPWVADSIVKRRKYSESRRKNRKGKPKKDMKTYVNHMENEIENENEDINDNAIVSPSFEDFWELYDKRTGKIKCQKVWAKLKQKEKEEIMEYVPAYVEATPDKQYRKNPDGFLKNNNWKDEIIIGNELKPTRGNGNEKNGKQGFTPNR